MKKKPKAAEKSVRDSLREAGRELNKKILDSVKKEQDECPHLQGSNPLSEVFQSNLTAIVWHIYDDKVKRGICTNCQRKFVPSDPDYLKWVAIPSGNKLSAAGVEQPITKSDKPFLERSKQFSGLESPEPKEFGEDVFAAMLLVLRFMENTETIKLLREKGLEPNKEEIKKIFVTLCGGEYNPPEIMDFGRVGSEENKKASRFREAVGKVLGFLKRLFSGK